MTILRGTKFWWFVVIPWVALYHVAASFGVPRDAFHPGLPFEPLPVWPWTSIPYFSEYPAVVAVPFLALSADRFRLLIAQCWISIGLAFLFYFTLPSIAPRPPVPMDAFLGPFLSWERGNYPASVAFPSFHVIWAVLIAYAASDPQTPKWRTRLWWTWAVAVSLSCITTGMHWISDILAGAAVCWVAIRYREIWAWLQARVAQPVWIPAGIALAMTMRRLWVLGAPLYVHLLAACGFLAIGFAVQRIAHFFASRKNENMDACAVLEQQPR